MNNLGTVLWKYIEIIAKFFLVRLLHIRVTDKSWEGLMQLIKFGMVGVSNTLLGYIIYILSLSLYKAIGMFQGKEYFYAQIVMFILSVLWSFYWNNKAVFRQKDGEERNWPIALLKTYVSYAFTCLILSELLMYLEIEKWGWNDTISPLINMLITTPINFIIQKFWAYKNK